MKWLIFSTLCLANMGCSTIVSSKGTYADPCLTIKKADEEVVKADDIYLLLECHKKDQARENARLGALRGDVVLIDIYLQILSSDKREELGLAYALKGAELGDKNSMMWVERISEKLNIKTLNKKSFLPSPARLTK